MAVKGDNLEPVPDGAGFFAGRCVERQRSLVARRASLPESYFFVACSTS